VLFVPIDAACYNLLITSSVVSAVCFFAGAIMSAIYDEKKDEDGFLYVTYSGENTFGGKILL
jgi:hypothetical protein